MREVASFAFSVSPAKAWAAAKAASPSSTAADGPAAKRRLDEADTPQVGAAAVAGHGADVAGHGAGGGRLAPLTLQLHKPSHRCPTSPQDFVITAVSGSAAEAASQAAPAAPSEAAPDAAPPAAAATPRAATPAIPAPAAVEQSPPAVVEALSGDEASPADTAAAAEAPAAPLAPPAGVASLHRSPAVSHAVRSLGPVAESSPAIPPPPLPTLEHLPQVGAGGRVPRAPAFEGRRLGLQCLPDFWLCMPSCSACPVSEHRWCGCTPTCCVPACPTVQAAGSAASPAPARSMSLTRQLSRKLSRG